MDEIKLTVRLPRKVYEALKRRATGARRSLNAQIVVMLEGAVHVWSCCDRCGSKQGPWYQQWRVGETPGVHDRPGAWLCERCMRKLGEDGG